MLAQHKTLRAIQYGYPPAMLAVLASIFGSLDRLGQLLEPDASLTAYGADRPMPISSSPPVRYRPKA
jgi:hypothetical protein